MAWLVLGAAVMALIAAAGAYQLATGRYIGVGRFAASYEPTPRVARISGCGGMAAGVIGALIMWAAFSGHLPAK